MAAGTEVVFKVKATGGDLHFQWQKDRTDLHDGGRYCDTDTDTLHIVKVEMSDEGRYRCIVKNHLRSDEASLTVSELMNVNSSYGKSCLRPKMKNKKD